MSAKKAASLVYLVIHICPGYPHYLVSLMLFKQLNQLKIKEKIIDDKNIQLEKINERLIEGTKIKEEYIGYFFNVISGYIYSSKN